MNTLSQQSLGHNAARVVFVGVLVVATLAMGAVIWQDRSKDINEGIKSARNIATVLGGQIENSIQAIDISLRSAQGRVNDFIRAAEVGSEALPTSSNFRNELLLRLARLPQAYQIVITDRRGKLVLSTAAWPTPDINVSDREYFKELSEHDDDRLSIALPIENRVSGEPTIVLARRINASDRTFLGVIFISVKQSYFESIYRAVDAMPNQTFLLLRRDGSVVIFYPHVETRVIKKIGAIDAFRSVLANGGGNYRTIDALDGKVLWAAAYPLKNYPLVVNSGIPENEILQDWRTRAAGMAVGSSTFLAVALILLWMMTREHQSLIESRAALQNQNQRFDATLNSMSQGLAMYDADGRLAVCNERYRLIRRLSLNETGPGRALRDIVAHCQTLSGYPEDVDGYVAGILRNAEAGRAFKQDDHLPDGRIIAVSNDPMPDGGWVATFEDVTDRRKAETRIERLAHFDVLTGIANRSQFHNEIDKARAMLQASGAPFNVIMLDLDRFKVVNDSLGHDAGDALLREAAARLQASLRSSDVVARLGGDEFAIIQTPPRAFVADDNIDQVMRESAVMLANRLIELIGEPYAIGDQSAYVGASIGIAVAPSDGTDPNELVKKADLALYKTKSEGRNGYSFFDAQLAAAADERHQLEADLRAGLLSGEFELYFQPIVDLATRQPRCMEALVRWNHPTRGLISPDRFIALAEETGLVSSLGEWIIQTACAQAVLWPPHVKVSVNISPIQFRKTDLLDVIMCALVDSGLAPERLMIEITEQVLLDSQAEYLAVLHQLKNLGVAIALDDFGTGYSSLSYLQMFPFDKIKIDQSFTRGLMERSDSAAIACAVINLGRALDIETIAEGVETEDQLQVLRAAGLGLAQGFLFSRPMPASSLCFEADIDASIEIVVRKACGGSRI